MSYEVPRGRFGQTPQLDTQLLSKLLRNKVEAPKTRYAVLYDV